jgi:uncharacterized membrane protein (DUF485 family)
MNRFISKSAVLTLSIFMSLHSLARAQEIEMADTMRSEGKIYVVVVIAAIALTILSIYLFRIDKKVSKLEKEIKNR